MKRFIGQILRLLALCLCSFELMGLTIQSPPKLILLQQFIRHGGRYPSGAQDLVKNSYPMEKSGYLTNAGGRMSYLLGKELNKLYWKKLFGNSKQLRKEQFRVRSSLFNRTIETAEAHNLGLLQNIEVPFIDEHDSIYVHPPFGNSNYKSPHGKGKNYLGPLFGPQNRKTHFLPIDSVQYHFAKSYEGDFLAKHTEEACPRQKIWRAENLGGERYRHIFEEPRYLAAVEKLEKAFNVMVGGEQSLARYYSSIVSLRDLGVTLPPLCSESSPDYKDLSVYSAINFFVCNFGDELQLHTLMSGIFAEIITNAKAKAALGATYPSWFIYATHEEIIGGFLAILDLMSIDCMLETLESDGASGDCEAEIPRFCSSIIFEFYQYQHSNRVTFKLRYNGEYRKLRFCNDKYECDLSSLDSWFQTWKVDAPKTCADV